ncbi:MAG: EAL domain-containing protein [Pseudomonadota bacterium]
MRRYQLKVRELSDQRKALEESLAKALQQKQQALLRCADLGAMANQAIENTPIGVAFIRSCGEIFRTNPVFSRMFLNEAAPAGQNLQEFVAKPDHELFGAFLRQLVDAASAPEHTNFDCVNGAGDPVRTLMTASVVRNDQGEFRFAVIQIQDVTEASVLTDKLKYHANFDELTGLHNRRAFQASLRKLCDETQNKSAFLMFMDLDQFKVVNDTSGHAAGDELLRCVAELLRQSVRKGDLVARLGGDEFAILLDQCPEKRAASIAESICTRISEYAFHWNSDTFRVGVSIGLVPVGEHGKDPEELQQLADAACYAAKEAGRNQVHLVKGASDRVEAKRGEMRWVARLGDAMDQNQFALFGQRIIPLQPRSKEPERIEVLLRLRNTNERDLVLPGAFLPAAERYGLSSKLDEWVVRNLLRSLYIYRTVGAEHRRYWVNLSGASIGDRKFCRTLLHMMEESPLPPGMVNFEITETAVIRSIGAARELMTALKALGSEFALDDFGSGLSSFGHLKHLPVDYLKIDGMFVRDIVQDETDRVFVKSIIDIAHTMGIRTVAEYVESASILDAITQLGADFAQGYHVHAPEMLAPVFPGELQNADSKLRSKMTEL